MNSILHKVGIAGVCALSLGVAISTPTAAAQGDQEGLRFSVQDGELQLTGAGLALKADGKAQKSQDSGDSDSLGLASQDLTPYRGQTDKYAVVDETGRVVDAVLDRTVDVTGRGAARTGWVRTSDSVALEWPAADGISEWKVRKPNGKTVTTSQTILVDNTKAEKGTYLIAGTAGDGAVTSYVLTIPDAPSQDDHRETALHAESSAVEPEQWRGLYWTAFIEKDKIKAKIGPWDTCTEAKSGYHYYGGDDRGYVNSVHELYNGEEPRFRIGSMVASTWKYPTWVNPSIYDGLIGRAAGLTTAYDESGTLVDSARADAVADIKLVRGTSEILPPNLGGLGLATREVKMSSANPLCSLPGDLDAPSIDVEYTYRHTSNGWVTVQGSHDRAPMHEAFWASSTDEDDPNKPNGCLYRFENQGFPLLGAPLELGVDVTLDFNPDVEAPTCVTVTS